MPVETVLRLTESLLYTALLLSLPAVAVSLITGVIISILQTLFSIQEQTLSFAPRIVLVGVAIIFSLPWMLQILTGFTTDTFHLMTYLVR